jgi:hypothetical protein
MEQPGSAGFQPAIWERRLPAGSLGAPASSRQSGSAGFQPAVWERRLPAGS